MIRRFFFTQGTEPGVLGPLLVIEPQQLVRVMIAKCYLSDPKVRICVDSLNQYREIEVFYVTLCNVYIANNVNRWSWICNPRQC